MYIAFIPTDVLISFIFDNVYMPRLIISQQPGLLFSSSRKKALEAIRPRPNLLPLHLMKRKSVSGTTGKPKYQSKNMWGFFLNKRILDSWPVSEKEAYFCLVSTRNYSNCCHVFFFLENCMRKVALQWTHWRKLEISNLNLLERRSSSMCTSSEPTPTMDSQQNQTVCLHSTRNRKRKNKASIVHFVQCLFSLITADNDQRVHNIKVYCAIKQLGRKLFLMKMS